MLPIAPSRGLIFDRNGIPLVQNITLYRLQVILSKIPDMAALLQQLTPIVDLTPDDIASFRDDMHHTSRYKAVTLKSDLSDVEVASLRGQRIPLPGVTVESYQQREYPTAQSWRTWWAMCRKSTTAICSGWRKTAKRRTTPPTAISVSRASRAIMKSAHGTTGYQEVEVDNHGRVVRLLKEVPPVAGKPLSDSRPSSPAVY